MKSKFLIAATLLTISFISCEKSDDSNSVVNNNEVQAKTTVTFTDDEVKEFKDIVLTSNLPSLITEWKGYINARDSKNVILTNDKIINEQKVIASKFKGDVIQMIDYLGEIETYGTHDGNPCTRNLDSTLYTGTCTFWGMIAVGIKGAFSCDKPGGPAYLAMTKAEQDKAIDNYYDCMQSVVCETC